MILLDTNVLSELVRPTPDASVIAWVAAQRRADLCTTTISEAELAYGIASMPKGRRRELLDQAVGRLLVEGLGGRVLGFDRAAAQSYGSFVARRRAKGRPVAMADAAIAAIATSRGFNLIATRNLNDFHECGVHLVNPWSK